VTKESKRLQRNMHELAQEAFAAQAFARYEEERSHVVTPDEATAFAARWTKIADLLADGWILDFEAVDIFKGKG
jgi:hypothetical protein